MCVSCADEKTCENTALHFYCEVSQAGRVLEVTELTQFTS